MTACSANCPSGSSAPAVSSGALSSSAASQVQHTLSHIHHPAWVLQIQELSPSDPVARATVTRLTPVVEQEREKLKDEMLGEAWQRTSQ